MKIRKQKTGSEKNKLMKRTTRDRIKESKAKTFKKPFMNDL